MLAIDKQMQELLGKMQRHNQLIAAQHLDIEKRHEVRLFHKQTMSANAAGSVSDSARWPTKIDFSLFDKVTHVNLRSRPDDLVTNHDENTGLDTLKRWTIATALFCLPAE